VGELREVLRRVEAEGRVPRVEAAASDDLETPGEIRWEGAIFERVTSIEQQLAILAESLGKREPDFEARLLQVVDSRIGSLEEKLHWDWETTRVGLRRLMLALAAIALLLVVC
jgi:hypothetical protein